MSTLTRDPGEIENFRRGKQRVEQQLARELYQVFNTGTAIANLRAVVQRGLTNMGEGNPNAIARALTSERFLDVLSRNDIRVPKQGLGDDQALQHIGALIRAIGGFTASDCSDAIRLVGAYHEEIGGEAERLQSSYRGGVLPWEPDQAVKGWAGRYWEDGKAAVWANGNRDRGKVPGMETLPFSGEERGPASKSGMQLKRAWRWSNVRKMDQLFGLLVGADISGTTADSTHIIELWGADLLEPVYYLLPAATIVFNMHHTLLEVALVLSINKIIDYRIGFYNTLLPGEPDDVPAHMVGVFETLNRAETSADNRHFLLYYDQQREPPAGCLLFANDELDALRGLDLSNALRLHALLQNAPRYPTKQKVVELVQRTAPSLYANTPLDFRT